MAQTNNKTNKADRPKNRAQRLARLSNKKPRVNRTSYYYLSQYARIWYYLRLSIPLDLLVYGIGLDYTTPRAPEFTLFEYSVALILLSITFIIGLGGPSELYLRLREIQRRFSNFKNPLLYPFIAIMLGLIPLSEIAIRVAHLKSALVGIFFGFLIASSIIYILKQSRKVEAQIIRFDQEPIRWVEHQNRLVFGFNLAPLVVLRVLSLLLAYYLGSISHPFWQSIILLGTCWILLLSLRPTTDSFMANCPRCQLLTSAVVKELGFCPACDNAKFNISKPNVEPAKAVSSTETTQHKKTGNGRNKAGKN